jgi:predicted amidohydrolase
MGWGLNIYIVQLDITWENKAANFDKVRALLAANRPERNSLILLPEMFATGFSMNLAVTQQSSAREDECFLATIAGE